MVAAARNETDSAPREATIDLPSDGETVITRVFDAPASLVWKAMTTPEHIKRWYGLRSLETTIAEYDPRPGGKWRFVQRAPDGEEYAFSGVIARSIRPTASSTPSSSRRCRAPSTWSPPPSSRRMGRRR